MIHLEQQAKPDELFPCLICGKKLEAATSPDLNNDAIHVLNNYGVCFGIPLSTTGAYGSQILDMGPEVHFVICDICFLKRRHRVLIQDGDEIIEGATYFEDWGKAVSDDPKYYNFFKEGFEMKNSTDREKSGNG